MEMSTKDNLQMEFSTVKEPTHLQVGGFIPGNLKRLCRWKGKLTTEGQATYEGTFKQGFINMKIKWLSVIRVIGLVFVLLYHFFIKYFPGGFVGVDLFFTLSGYLTTALLIDEFAKHKNRYCQLFQKKVLSDSPLWF